MTKRPIAEQQRTSLSVALLHAFKMGAFISSVTPSSQPDLMPRPEASFTTSPFGRFDSLDTFRGLTIITMIFFNDLGTKGIPLWLQHAQAHEDRMTVVDVIFPAFLFIMGMSLPLSFLNARRRGVTKQRLLVRACTRCFGLLVMGYFLVNRWSMNLEVSWFTSASFSFLSVVAMVFCFNQWPVKTEFGLKRAIGFRVIGWVMFAFLALGFCGGEPSEWMRPQWWGILGLLGWAYLISYLIFSLVGLSLTKLLCAISFLLSLRTLQTPALGLTYFSSSPFRQLIEIGVLASITLTGVLVSRVLIVQRFSSEKRSFSKQARVVLLLSLSLFLTGYLLRPLLGASKIRATPTWSLYASGCCCLVFLFLYWLVDLKDKARWARLIVPAGRNPLLIYLLPTSIFSLLSLGDISLLDDYFGAGALRFIRASSLTVLILWLGSWLSKRGLTLRL